MLQIYSDTFMYPLYQIQHLLSVVPSTEDVFNNVSQCKFIKMQ